MQNAVTGDVRLHFRKRSVDTHSGRRSLRLIAGTFAVATRVAAAAPASAQDLMYQPVNPSFGGNPFNSSHLLGLAETQKDFKDPDAVDRQSSGLSQTDLFVRNLQSRLLSNLSGQVVDAIFGENAAESGEIVFGDQRIAFERTLDSVDLTIVNTADGTSTTVQVPTLILNN